VSEANVKLASERTSRPDVRASTTLNPEAQE